MKDRQSLLIARACNAAAFAPSLGAWSLRTYVNRLDFVRCVCLAVVVIHRWSTSQEFEQTGPVIDGDKKLISRDSVHAGT